MFPHINHPNFVWGVSVDDLIALKGERFFEVYNGHPLVHNYGDDTRPSTETMWDQINIAYSNRNQPLMFGLATDDTHDYHEFGSSFANAGRGWIMVQADSLNPASIINAMEAGNFYATTGVKLKSVRTSGRELKIQINPEKEVQYVTEFIGVYKGKTEATIIKRVDGIAASCSITDDLLFMRARITSSKEKENPFQDGDFEMAWTQPIQP